MLRAFADDAQLQTALNDAGFELIGIGQGNLKALKGWGKLNRWPLGKLYSDFEQPSLPAFAALGANFRGKPTTCCKVAKDALKGTLHGLRVVVGGCRTKSQQMRTHYPCIAHTCFWWGVFAPSIMMTVIEIVIRAIPPSIPTLPPISKITWAGHLHSD